MAIWCRWGLETFSWQADGRTNKAGIRDLFGGGSESQAFCKRLEGLSSYIGFFWDVSKDSQQIPKGLNNPNGVMASSILKPSNRTGKNWIKMEETSGIENKGKNKGSLSQDGHT